MIVRVTTKFDRDGFNKRVEKAVNAGITRAAHEGKQWMVRGLGKGRGDYAASAAGSPPNRQRSGLANSITSTTATNFRAAAGSPIPYALIQEKGGTIRPKKGKFLPVPMNIPAKRIMEEKGTPKGTPANLVRTRAGRLLLIGEDKRAVQNRSGRKTIAGHKPQGDLGVPIWILVKKVRLPARPWCLPAVTKNWDDISRKAIKHAANIFRTGIGGGA